MKDNVFLIVTFNGLIYIRSDIRLDTYARDRWKEEMFFKQKKKKKEYHIRKKMVKK